jgi:hypothetical protein
MALGKHNARVRANAGAVGRRLGNALVPPGLADVLEGRANPTSGHMRFTPDPWFEKVREHAARSFKAAGFRDVVLIGDSGENQPGQRAVAPRLSRESAGTPVPVQPSRPVTGRPMPGGNDFGPKASRRSTRMATPAGSTQPGRSRWTRTSCGRTGWRGCPGGVKASPATRAEPRRSGVGRASRRSWRGRSPPSGARPRGADDRPANRTAARGGSTQRA